MLQRFSLDKFIAAHRKLVSQLNPEQVSGLTFLLNKLFDDVRVPHIRWAAYILATTKWETGHTYQPIKEWPGKDPNYTRYDPGRHPDAIKMGHTQPGDGKKWPGRGFVGLTWKNNYQWASDELGIDLVSRPDRALEPDIAYEIMIRGMTQGKFTGLSLSRVIALAPNPPRYVQARAIINGSDKAKEIAAIAEQLEQCFLAARI